MRACTFLTQYSNSFLSSSSNIFLMKKLLRFFNTVTRTIETHQKTPTRGKRRKKKRKCVPSSVAGNYRCVIIWFAWQCGSVEMKCQQHIRLCRENTTFHFHASHTRCVVIAPFRWLTSFG